MLSSSPTLLARFRSGSKLVAPASWRYGNRRVDVNPQQRRPLLLIRRVASPRVITLTFEVRPERGKIRPPPVTQSGRYSVWDDGQQIIISCMGVTTPDVVIKNRGKRYTCAVANTARACAQECILRGATKKSRYYLPSHQRDPFFDRYEGLFLSIHVVKLHPIIFVCETRLSQCRFLKTWYW